MNPSGGKQPVNYYENLLSRVRSVRRKWRAQVLAKGLALFLVSSITLLVLSVWGADLLGFKSAAVWLMRVITCSAVIFVAARCFYLPLRRRITDVQIAQYIEERYPNLEDRLVTAVEFGSKTDVSSGMLDLLIRDALNKTSRLDFSVFTDRRRLAVYGALGSAALLALLALSSWGPSFFHFGLDRLYMPWTEASGEAPWTILVTPGNLELAKGSDQQIKVQLVGFDSADVRLNIQHESNAAWTSMAMDPEPRGTGFLYLLIDLRSSLRYYVEAKGVRSSTYRLSIVDLPRVERIDLQYTFPAYTGMAPQLVSNEGDISALMGTKVDLKVRMNQSARAARLLFDDQSTLELSKAGSQDFMGSITLQRSGSYVVQIDNAGAKRYAGSPEYEIQALEDAPPKVTLTKPLRDLRATNVEEVFTELKAEDDIGVGKVELHFSVNGGEEKTLTLHRGQSSESAITAAHTFFLEEFNLQPGDVISYYGKASDNNNVTGPGTSSSDIYFIQIRPFEQKYTQSQQGGAGAGGSSGDGAQEALSKQQKEIISATFKLIRDRKQMDAKEYVDGLKTAALVQSRLQVQTQGLLERLKRRGAAELNEDFGKLAEYLRIAAGQMEKAAVQLGAEKPTEALPDEQKALQQLMRAESLFREIQISFASQMGRGGAGSQANAEDLADLFELELNKLKNQYETVQRGEQQARDQKLDEALQRLKELAQRQQQIVERNRLMASRGGSSTGGSDGGRSQQQLIDEAENLQRQLQRLSRERSSPELNRVSSQLRQAIEEMRKAAEQSQRNSVQEANARSTRALQKLEDARRALARGQQAGLSQGVDAALEESKRLVDEQSRIQEGVGRLAQEKQQAASPQFQTRRDDLMSRKTSLADRLNNLGKKIDDLSGTARQTQRETSSKLNDAAGVIRDKKLPERILSGNQLLENGFYDFMKGREDYIRAGLEELAKQLESAKSSVGKTKEGKLEDAVSKTRQLAEGLEAMRQKLRAQAGAKGGQREARGTQRTDQRDQQAGQGAQATQGQRGQREGGAQASSGQGQDQQAAGGSPSANGRDWSRNSNGPPIGAGPYNEGELRQLRREIQERMLDAQELRRLLDRNPTQLQNLEKVIEALRNQNNAPAYNQAEHVARLKVAIDLLHQVEQDLSRELAQLTQREKYLSAEDNEVPDAYKRLVEEYYKALAKGKQ